ncbi:MAG: RNA polymerase sigma factor [Minisyncoccia bacterium]
MVRDPELSDANVLQKSQEAPWMFGILVERHQEAFLRKGESILHSRDAAEDAVQETFIKIYKYSHKFSERKGASFRSWAYRILVNTCYTHSSKKTREASRVKAIDFAELDLIGSEVIRDREQLSFVQSVLSRLPENLARLLSLYFFEEKSYEEIAEIERLSLSAVRSGLHRAKKQFRVVALQMA